MLLYDVVDVAEETVEAVAFLDGDDEVVHHLPVVLHLLPQVPLQPSHKAFANVQLELHLVRVHSLLLHSFVSLHAGLPLFLPVVGLALIFLFRKFRLTHPYFKALISRDQWPLCALSLLWH